MPASPASGPLAVAVANVYKPLNAVTVTTEATIWTPASGKRFRLMGMFLSGSAAGNFTLKDNTAGTTIAIFPVVAGTLSYVDFGGGIPSALAGNVLTCTGPGGAATISGTIWGIEE